MYRKYIIDIYYDSEDGVGRKSMHFIHNAHDDLEAFKWICRDNRYQNLNYSQNIDFRMRSEAV